METRRGVGQHEDAAACCLPAKQRRRPVEPDEVDRSAAGSLEARLQIELGCERKIPIDGHDAEVHVAVPAQGVACGGPEQDSQTQLRPITKGHAHPIREVGGS